MLSCTAVSETNARSVPSCSGVGPPGVGTLARRSASAASASRSPFEGLALLVGEVELFEHLLDAVLDGR